VDAKAAILTFADIRELCPRRRPLEKVGVIRWDRQLGELAIVQRHDLDGPEGAVYEGKALRGLNELIRGGVPRRRQPRAAGPSRGHAGRPRLCRSALARLAPRPSDAWTSRSLLGDCHRVAIIGDNLDADIAGGKRAGLTTILVLSGTTAQKHLAAVALQPDLVLPSLAALVGGHRQ
jgi:phosphoglycolate phosphatase-like HAD superfamily hydrolase